MTDAESSTRVDAIVDLISRLARGDFSARGPEGTSDDELDAIITALNMLAEDFEIERGRRQQAESELGDAVEAYETAPALFCSVDASSGRIVQCNRTFADVLELGGEAIGRDLRDFYAVAERPGLSQTLAMLARGEALTPRDHHLVSGSGKKLSMLLSGTVVVDDSGMPTRLRLIYRDVTAERELESRLSQAQKLDAMGRLAGGVAHDFNNILAVILSLAELLKLDERSPQRLEDLEQISSAAERGAELASDLLVFSRQTPVQAVPVDANALAQRMVKLLQRTLPPSICVVVEPAAELWTVLADPGRLEQALLNVAINARDAMPQGGRLTVRTENVVVDDPSDRLAGTAGRRFVAIHVEDQGTGMDEETQSKVLEPFFTTKAPGKGTGLGLSIVHGIVQQAGGQLRIESAPGCGTTVSLVLPADVAGARGTAPSLERSSGGFERILVVDDDQAVGEVTCRVLREAGYQVLRSHGGRDALAMLDREHKRVDLVITDVLMPGLSGLELARAIVERGRGEKILLVSGFSGASGDERWPLLRKPCKPRDLLLKVRALLDG